MAVARAEALKAQKRVETITAELAGQVIPVFQRVLFRDSIPESTWMGPVQDMVREHVSGHYLQPLQEASSARPISPEEEDAFSDPREVLRAMRRRSKQRGSIEAEKLLYRVQKPPEGEG